MPRVALLTSGGIAPCLSAAVGGLIEKYNEISPDSEIIGYKYGYRGLLLGESITFSQKVKDNYEIFYDFGGTPVGNSRVKLTNVDDCVKKGSAKNIFNRSVASIKIIIERSLFCVINSQKILILQLHWQFVV